jgi:hypothetical protein
MTTPRPARRALAATALVLTCALGVVSACGDDDDDTAATTTTAAASTGTVGNVLPPVIADLGSIDGTTVDVKVDGVIDLTGDDETYADWEADIADPAVAEFTPGRDEGGASFNPGITGLAAGSTEVTLTNSTSDETVTFTVTVTD